MPPSLGKGRVNNNNNNKDGDWRAVSAQELQSELTRDAFITGITSSFIKQRLLEEDSLTLDDAISKAEILERAQNQSGSL